MCLRDPQRRARPDARPGRRHRADELFRALGGAAYRGAIVLSHLHWDHVQGLPFFTAGDTDAVDVTMYLPAQDSATPGAVGSAEKLLRGAMSPPHFPIGPDELRGGWRFAAADAGRRRRG